MTHLGLSFACGEKSLSVRRFSVREAMSAPFEVTVWARSPSADLELDVFVGRPAAFYLDSGLPGGQRAYHGVCRAMRRIKAVPGGLSTYAIRIVPALWRLTQRRDHRIFQHLSLPGIARAVLAEWQIEARFSIDEAAHPSLEYRVQYGETDYAFLCRTLEEAGISFFFEEDEVADRTVLVLADAYEHRPTRALGPLPYVDAPIDAGARATVTRVRSARAVRPERLVVRDHDFRARADVPVAGFSSAGGADPRLEIYRFGAGTIVSDKGDARPTEEGAHEVARRWLDAERLGAEEISFVTNAFDLRPGCVFVIVDHPSAELDRGRRLLSRALDLRGGPGREWTANGRAVPADRPFRPARSTPKPRIAGVQSAVVVGPKSEEIHTDPFGRVRVQFPWDRQGHFDEHSSCWVRVSQGWAGAGFGSLAVPRVGHEVLVSFFEGDPDQPIVVGRVYGGAHPVPYELPANKTVTAWRSRSTPGGAGASELRVDDACGRELVHVHAQGDLRKIVQRSEVESTGGSRTASVAGDRRATIGGVDETMVGDRYAVSVAAGSGSGGPAGIEIREGRLVLTSGQARVVIDGPNILLEAPGALRIHSLYDDVLIQGGPNVKLNSGLASSKSDLELVVVDPFGNPIQRSLLRAEVHVEGRDPEVHDAFTGAVATQAAGKSTAVRLFAQVPADGDEE